MTNENDSAFTNNRIEMVEDDTHAKVHLCPSLTKREYMATAILQGLMANPERYKYITDGMKAVLVPGQSEPLPGMSQAEATAKNARKAVMIADALIDALNADKETK